MPSATPRSTRVPLQMTTFLPSPAGRALRSLILTELRPIFLAKMDKVRPVLVLSRQAVIPHLRQVTVAPIPSRIRGLSVEVGLGQHNGLHQDCVINCDNVTT